MNWKKSLGIALIFTGLFVSLMSRIITGAVVGFKPGDYLGVFGILIFIAGIVLLLIVRLEIGGGRNRS